VGGSSAAPTSQDLRRWWISVANTQLTWSEPSHPRANLQRIAGAMKELQRRFVQVNGCSNESARIPGCATRR
jgi:hypothetical protein